MARHIVYDAKRARLVLDEIGSHNLQILLDPVNMLSMDNVDRREEVFAEAIELLGKDVAMIHFKDFLRHDADGQLKACGAGQGEMEDYSTILRFAKQEKPSSLLRWKIPPRKMPWRAVSSCRNSTTTAEEGYDRRGCCTSSNKKTRVI